MAEEEIIDFGFSAVTADEYEADNTDGENTGGGGTYNPETIASIDSKVEQIMAHLASMGTNSNEADLFSKQDETNAQLGDIELKVDKILKLETEEILGKLTDVSDKTDAVASKSADDNNKSGEVVGKQNEIMDFLKDMSPKIDKILKLESLEALLEQSTGKTDEALSKVQNINVDPPDLSPVIDKLDDIEPKIDKILKMEAMEAVQSLQQSSADMSTVVKEIEERKKELNKTYKARMLAVEKLILPLIANLQKDGNTKEYIKWPNRIEILEGHKSKILQVTRSEI